MDRIKIFPQRCKGCKLCIASCPRGLLGEGEALNTLGLHPAYFKGGECIGCALCAQVCPECCIEVYKIETRNLKNLTAKV